MGSRGSARRSRCSECGLRRACQHPPEAPAAPLHRPSPVQPARRRAVRVRCRRLPFETGLGRGDVAHLRPGDPVVEGVPFDHRGDPRCDRLPVLPLQTADQVEPQGTDQLVPDSGRTHAASPRRSLSKLSTAGWLLRKMSVVFHIIVRMGSGDVAAAVVCECDNAPAGHSSGSTACQWAQAKLISMHFRRARFRE